MIRLLAVSFASLKRVSSSTTTTLTQKIKISSSSNGSIATSLSSQSLRVLPEVRDAISSGRPVVALESTILAHGLPHPENIELAKELSHIIRSKGAIPATIAIKDGQCCVGLTNEELCDLTVAGVEKRAVKCSTRDIPLIISSHHRHASTNINSSMSDLQQKQLYSHQWGATTVASTMRLAHLAGISTFVTGGTGGVHRGGENTLDISADLLELSRTPVIVVSAGIKSILDIPRTLETLETHGVPTAVFGPRTSSSKTEVPPDFPAFFSPTSGIPAPFNLETPDDVARAYRAGRDLDLPNGLLLAVPNYNPAGDAVENAIVESLQEAERQGIMGRDVTPFILKRVAERTGGASLRSNIALVKRNASVGAEVAIAVANLSSGGGGGGAATSYGISRGSEKSKSFSSSSISSSSSSSSKYTVKEPKSRILVMGGSVIDLVAKPHSHHHHPTSSSTDALTPSHLVLGTSNPGTLLESDGGVARNITEVLARLDARPTLYSSVGDDARGLALRHRLAHDLRGGGGGADDPVAGSGVVGVEEHVHVMKGAKTPTYLAVLDGGGDLHVGIAADMEDCLEGTTSVPDEEALRGAEVLVMDGNPRVETLVEVAREARSLGLEKVMFEPTSVHKARRVVGGGSGGFLGYVMYAFPNEDELFAMTEDVNDDVYVVDEEYFTRRTKVMDGSLREQAIRKASTELLSKMNLDGQVAYLIVTLGAEGAILCSRSRGASSSTGDDNIEFRHRPARVIETEDIKNCTGAGDTLVGAFANAVLDGKDAYTALGIGMEAAIESLKCGDRAIPTTLQ